MKENKNPLRWKEIAAIVAAVVLLIGVGVGAVALMNSGFRFSAAGNGTEPSEIIQEPSSFETTPTDPTEPCTEPTMDTQPVETNPAETKPRDEEWHRARDIALEYVGVSVMELTELESETDENTGIIVFEFGTMTDHYEVKIRLSDAAVEKAVSKEAPVTELHRDDVMTRQDALKLLFDELGVEWSDLRHLETDAQLTVVPIFYKIEFHTVDIGGTYYIHAKNGTTLRSEPLLPPDGRISQANAVRLVLENLGATIHQIKDLDADFEKQDDGTFVYEIAFDFDGYEYEFTVTSIGPGTILSMEKEPLDPNEGKDREYTLTDAMQERIINAYRKANKLAQSYGVTMEYYGEYDGAYAVMIHCFAETEAVSNEHIGGITFTYPTNVQMLIYYQGRFHTLTSAYGAGIMEYDDVFDLYEYYNR